jgi:hypothetical protein
MDDATWLGRGPESVAHGVARAKYRVLLPKVGSAGRKQRGSEGGGGPACGVAHRDLRLCTFVRVQLTKLYLRPETREVKGAKGRRRDGERGKLVAQARERLVDAGLRSGPRTAAYLFAGPDPRRPVCLRARPWRHGTERDNRHRPGAGHRASDGESVRTDDDFF